MKKLFLAIAALIMAVSAVSAENYKFNAVVAADGSGDFTTIQEAIYAQKHFSYDKIYIKVKNGVYKEKLEIPSWITNVVLVGESRDGVIITNDDHSGKVTDMGKLNTFTSYTLKVLGNRTKLINLTIENNAPQKGQAVALHIEADGVLIKNCKLIGNQDTMYANGEKIEVLMIDTYIEGTTDYIFGSAKLFIDNCTFHCKRNSFITAASTPAGRDFGYAIFNSTITADDDVTKMFLGRPWRNYAQTVFIDCSMGDFITPEGWQNWGRPEAEKTAYYGEYGTKGVDVSKRVGWSHQLTKKETARYFEELARMKKQYIE